MRNERIGTTLKKYRKMNALSVNNVSLILKEKYHRQVAAKTIYGWESNQASPSTEMFLILCDLYKIRQFNELYGKPKQKFAISAFEIKLIQNYRKHPELHPAIHILLEMEN